MLRRLHVVFSSIMRLQKSQVEGRGCEDFVQEKGVARGEGDAGDVDFPQGFTLIGGGAGAKEGFGGGGGEVVEEGEVRNP
jgi:hypothetical protein